MTLSPPLIQKANMVVPALEVRKRVGVPSRRHGSELNKVCLCRGPTTLKIAARTEMLIERFLIRDQFACVLFLLGGRRCRLCAPTTTRFTWSAPLGATFGL